MHGVLIKRSRCPSFQGCPHRGVPLYYHSVLGRRPWALKHSPLFQPGRALIWDINCIRLYGAAILTPWNVVRGHLPGSGRLPGPLRQFKICYISNYNTALLDRWAAGTVIHYEGNKKYTTNYTYVQAALPSLLHTPSMRYHGDMYVLNEADVISDRSWKAGSSGIYATMHSRHS